MASPTNRRAFIALHLVLALVALVQGAQSLSHAAHELASHQHIAAWRADAPAHPVRA